MEKTTMSRYNLKDEETKCATEPYESQIRIETVRERLERKINYSEEQIKFNKAVIKEAKSALATLDKNKDLETVVNLLQR